VTLLEQILALTATIEARVEAGDWPGAAALDAERRELLTRLLAGQPTQLDAGVRRLFEELLARNRATVARAEVQRTEVGDALTTLASAPTAVRAYSLGGPATRPTAAESETP
jgi:hypothetical protein